MRRRYATSERLILRKPLPQLDIGSLVPGESAIVQNSPNYVAAPQEVTPQDELPQQVQSVGPAPTSSISLANGSPSESPRIVQITRVSPSSATVSSSSAVLLVPPVSSSIASSSVISTYITPSSSVLPSSTDSSSRASSSVALSSAPTSSSVTTSTSMPASSSASTPPESASIAFSAAASGTSAAAARPYTMTHGAPFDAVIILGALIVVALLATLAACLFRLRVRRRDAATKIGWDPVVLEDGKASPDDSLAGDRDVGEPKRSDSFLGGSTTTPLDAGYPQHPNPFAESAYYSPHEIAPLADSTAYPLPPIRSQGGPYPTARPLPAHLADRDPHRVSARGSPASSRSGSLRSQLHSATSLGALCVANGPSSRASTVLGMNAPQLELSHHEALKSLGTPREREARPRYMSLEGRGLDVPWRRESFAVRGGGTPGWARLPAARDEEQGQAERGETQGQQVEGWTQTIRASVLGAFQAVTGTAMPSAAPWPEDDGLTRAPSMARARRELGWRRFAAQEIDDNDSDASTIDIREPRGHFDLPPPPAALQLSGISMARSDADTVRTEHSRVPLIPRPLPVSRASSVYSTVSAVPPQPACASSEGWSESDYSAYYSAPSR